MAWDVKPSEQRRAAGWMADLGIGFTDSGCGFQVHQHGRYLTSGEVIAWLSGTSRVWVQPAAAKGMVR